jgi:hypothetical protein
VERSRDFRHCGILRSFLYRMAGQRKVRANAGVHEDRSNHVCGPCENVWRHQYVAELDHTVKAAAA